MSFLNGGDVVCFRLLTETNPKSSHLCVGVDSVDDSDDAVDFGIGSEDAHDALVTLVREWRLKEHFLVDGAVLGEVGDDGVDEPHLVRCEGA